MGCFNKMGFHSHLPITYGNDIVMFICADNTKKYVIDDTPIEIITLYSPMCLPIFGKYDEYGFIKDIIPDANTKLIEEKTGKTIEDVLSIIYKETDDNEEREVSKIFSNSYNEIPSLILTMERKDVFDTMVELSNKPYISKSSSRYWCNIGDFWLHQLGFIKKERIKYHYRYELKDYNGDFYIISCGSYPEIVNDKTNFDVNCYDFDTLISKWKECTGIELKLSDEKLSVKNEIDLSFELSSKFYHRNINKMCLGEDITCIAHKDYAPFPNDIIPFNRHCRIEFNSINLYKNYYNIFTDDFKKICCDFAKFNSTLSKLCGKYDVSMYGNQDVADTYYLELFKQLNQKYIEIIDKKIKKNNEEDNIE